MKSIERCLVRPDATIRDVLNTLGAAAEGVALMVDTERRLLGVLTDGDMRRAFLRGFGLKDLAKSAIDHEFVSVSPCMDRAGVLDVMQARRLRHIPIVDERGILVGLHLLREIVGHQEKSTWAVIMAGGKGTRLGKLTASTPKPMLKVAGRPILERAILHLVHHGITQIYLAVHHLAHVVEDYFGDGRACGCTIQYLRETQPLGSAGALSLLPDKPNESLLLLNGDLLIEADLSQMLSFHELGGYYATMGVHYYTHEVPFGCVEIEQNQITALEEKPLMTKTINGGVYVLSPEAVGRVPFNAYFPATQLFEQALEAGLACGAYPLGGDWADVGHPDQLQKARGSQ